MRVEPMDPQDALTRLLDALDKHVNGTGILDTANLHLQYGVIYDLDDVPVCDYCEESRVDAAPREFDDGDGKWCDKCHKEAARWHRDEEQYREDARSIR